jgi:hypothetical protein
MKASAPGSGPAARSLRCRGQHERRGGAVADLGHAGHDARGAGRQQGAGQAEQLVGAGRGEPGGLAAGQDEPERRAVQPPDVVHGHRAVVHPQTGEQRVVGPEDPVRCDVRQRGAVDRLEHPRRGRGPAASMTRSGRSPILEEIRELVRSARQNRAGGIRVSSTRAYFFLAV